MKIQIRNGGETLTLNVSDDELLVIGGGKPANRKGVVEFIERAYSVLLITNQRDYRAGRAKLLREEAAEKIREAEALEGVE